MNNRKLGNQGEDAALKYLREKGYTIITCNYHTRYGEVDIIALDGDIMVFVEVKARSSMKYGRGAEAVTQGKMDKLRKTALIYLQNTDQEEKSMRFDVIDILMKKDKWQISHIENAF